MLNTFLLGIYRDVTAWRELCLLLFVGTWERKNYPSEAARWEKQKKEKQVINHGNGHRCCLVVYDASGGAFTVNSYKEVSVSIPSSRSPRSHKWLRSKCTSAPAFRPKGGVCFVVRDALVRSESMHCVCSLLTVGLCRKTSAHLLLLLTTGTSGLSRVQLWS